MLRFINPAGIGSVCLSATLGLLAVSPGCTKAQRAVDSGDASQLEGTEGEPLEGPEYPPPGLEENPALPRSERPAPPPEP